MNKKIIMKHPSPTAFGFDKETKKWKSEECKEAYRKYVTEYAIYISKNQNTN